MIFKFLIKDIAVFSKDLLIILVKFPEFLTTIFLTGLFVFLQQLEDSPYSFSKLLRYCYMLTCDILDGTNTDHKLEACINLDIL